MNDKYKTLGKDVIIFAIGTIGSKLLLFLLIPLYTNTMSQGEFGDADLVLTVAQLLLPCVSLTIYDSVLRFGLMKEKNPGEVLWVAVSVFVVGSLLTILLVPVLMLYKPISPWVWYLVLYVITSFASQTLLLYLKAKQLNKLYSLLAIIQALILITCNILFLVVFKFGIGGYLLSNVLSCMGTALLAFLFGNIRRDLIGVRVNSKLFFEMVRYSIPLIFNSISWWGIYSVNKVLLENFHNSSTVGVYSVASKIPALMNVVSTIFNQAWNLATIKEYDTTNDQEMYSKVFSVYTTVIYTAFFVICLLIKPFMSFFVGDEFFVAWRYIPLLLLSSCFAAFSSFLESFYIASRKSVNAMTTVIIACICNIVLGVLLIGQMEIWGAVIGTLITYMLIAIIRMVDIRRFIKLDYHLKTFIPLSVLSIFIALIYSMNRQSILIVSICIGALFIINRKNYMEMIKKADALVKSLKGKNDIKKKEQK